MKQHSSPATTQSMTPARTQAFKTCAAVTSSHTLLFGTATAARQVSGEQADLGLSQHLADGESNVGCDRSSSSLRAGIGACTLLAW